jgi:hypothetical protein
MWHIRRMPFTVTRSVWALVFITLAGCVVWGVLAPRGLFVFIGLLSAFGPFIYSFQQLFESPPEARVPRR